MLKKTAIKLEGEIPSPIDPPSGCKFHTHCPFALDRCKVEAPEWREISDDHFVACHFADDLDLAGATSGPPAQVDVH